MSDRCKKCQGTGAVKVNASSSWAGEDWHYEPCTCVCPSDANPPETEYTGSTTERNATGGTTLTAFFAPSTPESDERDAQEFTSIYEVMFMNADTPQLSGREYIIHGFLAGRKGMVPKDSLKYAYDKAIELKIAMEVERAYERGIKVATEAEKMIAYGTEAVAEAVKAERDRIINEMKDYMRSPSFDVVDRLQIMRAIERRILNPGPPAQGEGP